MESKCARSAGVIQELAALCFILHSRSQARRLELSELGSSATVDVPVTLKMFMTLKTRAERRIGLE